MARHRTLAQFELFVMIAISALGDDAWSVAIADVLEERCGRSTSLGAVYVTLKRLEDKGLVRTESRPSDAARRPRNYYALTLPGRRQLRDTTALLARMMSIASASRGDR